MKKPTQDEYKRAKEEYDAGRMDPKDFARVRAAYNDSTQAAGHRMTGEVLGKLSTTIDGIAKRFDAFCARVDAEQGHKIPMPTDPKERAEYEAAIARRKAAGGGKYVGDH